jgi:hypothetical protein|tara:strand:+ start:464 stop:583 length:120 start_codon:yes stop_codon:yes gene_type:complete
VSRRGEASLLSFIPLSFEREGDEGGLKSLSVSPSEREKP